MDTRMQTGATAVRAKLFDRVAGMRVTADALPLAPPSLTASYEGTMTFPGTPGAVAVAAALVQAEGRLAGTVTLSIPDPAARGVYVLYGTMRDGGFVLEGRNASGARLRWRGHTTPDRGVRGPVRISRRGVHVAGLLTLARTPTDGACGAAWVGPLLSVPRSGARTDREPAFALPFPGAASSASR